jgi:hypothetical protein
MGLIWPTAFGSMTTSVCSTRRPKAGEAAQLAWRRGAGVHRLWSPRSGAPAEGMRRGWRLQNGWHIGSVPGKERRRLNSPSGLLRVKASLARVFQSGLKTGGGATTGGARGTITEVASEAS